MVRRLSSTLSIALIVLASNALIESYAQPSGPAMTDARLSVRTVIAGLATPTSIAFLGDGDMLVLEKNTGKVQRVIGGALAGTVLDLGVNNASERGLLGIALDPDFPDDPGVYLYWTCRSTAASSDPFFPDERTCLDANRFAPDSDEISAVPLLGNRVDRFVWNGSTLTFDRNLIQLRTFQADGAPVPPGQGDEEQPSRGNHNGGVIAFGPDRKLYVFAGDAGRRGMLQNLPSGPTPTGLGPTVADDQFGGPEPDDAHLSGMILRLNEDGSAPSDNPFHSGAPGLSGEALENVRKVFAYGIRNSFGMAFDPVSGALWEEENGEDAFDELNLVESGMNGGWIQVAGPLSRLGEFKQIETTSLHGEDFPNLQQFRWSPENIADTEEEARRRLFQLPGSHYSDPEFSWKFVMAPAAIGFLKGGALGPNFAGDLFVGFAVPFPEGGPLFHFNLTGNRTKIAVDDPRLADRVADNTDFNDLTESESLLIGTGFGVVTDIETAPDGHLIVVSISNGAVYEIFRAGRSE